MRNNLVGLAMLALVVGGPIYADEPAKRPFYMGFTSWPYAATSKAVLGTYSFIGSNGDIVAEHIEEGVPWLEAVQGKPFPKGFVTRVDGRRKMRPKGVKLLLSITPLDLDRCTLATLADDKGQQPLPKEWVRKRLNDPDVKKAYLNYCVWMTDRFKPDYLLTGIESNELLLHRPNQWKDYLELSQHVRGELKKKYPALPVAESITLHKLLDTTIRDLDAYRKAIKSFVAEHDFFGVSFYPFFLGQHTSREFLEALAFLPKFSDKPIAITETGHPAEDLVAKKFKLNFPSTPKEQDDFINALLTRAQEDRYLFVVCFTWKDFDELWKNFPPEAQDLGRLWRDTGLVDENDKRRPAYATWKKALARPRGEK
jgi:hypothetical protein